MRKFNVLSSVQQHLHLPVLTLLLVLTTVNISRAQVSLTATLGTPTGTFTTLKGAFDAINAGTHKGVIAITLTGNTTETAIAVLNASGTGSSSYTSISVKPTGGAARTISGSLASELIQLNGADNVTFDGLKTGGNTLTISNTSTSSTSGTSTIKFVNGATSNTITNCSVLGSATMQVTTNGGNIFFSTDGSTSNGNDNNTISNNDIGPSGTNLPTKCIYMNGSTTTTTIHNSGNTITNNNIFNYFSASNTSAGIYSSTGNNTNTFSNNKFYQTATRTQTSGTEHAAIWISATTGYAFTISGNTIGFSSSAGTGTYTFVGVSNSIFIPIHVNVGNTSATSIQGNTISNIAYSGSQSGTGTSSPFMFMYVQAGIVNIGNVTANTMGSMSATGNITYTSSSSNDSEVFGMRNESSEAWNTTNNTIGGITVGNSSSGDMGFYAMYCNTSSSDAWTCQNNTIGGTIASSIQNTCTSSNSLQNAIYDADGAATISGNTIRNFATAGGTQTDRDASITGIVMDASGTHSVYSNAINSLYATGASYVIGMDFHAGTTINVYKNKIYDLKSTNAGGFVYGLNFSAEVTTTNVYNNLIGDLKTPSTNNTTDGVRGLNLDYNVGEDENNATINFYYNTIYLNATSTGTNFSTSGVYARTESTSTLKQLNMRNNIIVNLSTPNGTGRTVAYRRSSTTLTNYASTSNNNLFYAGTPGTSRLIFYNGTTGYQTIATYKAISGLSPRDQASVTENPTFLSTSGASSSFLHIDPAVTTVVESGAVNISGYTDDYDADIRQGNPGYTGTGTFPDIGADEISSCTLTTWYADADGDGYGNAASTTSSCTMPVGYVANSTDCNDANSSVHPGATEVCNLIDDDCDGSIDEGVGTTFYADADGDTYGNPAVTVVACSAPTGYVSNNTDCNDANSAIHPGATEICNGIDDDCDASIDEGLTFINYYTDADGDGYGTGSPTSSCAPIPGKVTNNTDCNDANSAVHIGATEVCNLIDDDCDGLIDEGVGTTFYADADGDTYGNPAVTVVACSAPTGYVSNNTDCNDANNAIHPGATEVCNGIDDDCDASIDEGLTFINYYTDADGDGYGAGTPTSSCTPIPGKVTNNTDCNDANSSVHPGATEVCNLIDDDCDGLIDEGVGTTFYADADGDTYGDPAVTVVACSAPTGYVSNNTDCNDANSSVHPGATEVCNLIDDDCDGLIDEGVGTTFYADADGDTYGDPAVTVVACSAPVGYVSNNTDCNDANSAVHPGATEVCNLIDDDCDGLIDEGVGTTFYADADGDTYGDPAVTVVACSAPVGYVSNNTDCNDANSAVHPGATEVCNLIDDDCDGLIDEGVGTTFYADADGDTYGDPAVTIIACSAPTGYVSDNTDCNDADATVHEPLLYYVDEDLDGYGSTTEVYLCSSTAPEGYSTDNTDCFDMFPTVHPGAEEVCNSFDDDCDGLFDEGLTFITYYLDDDLDGYGQFLPILTSCEDPGEGFSTNNLDCDDTNSGINPDAIELCNGIDDDCDGSVDDGLTFLNYYPDVDLDTYGNSAATPVSSCSAIPGMVTNNGDCNDSDPTVHTPLPYFVDADHDGFGSTSVALVCSSTATLGYSTNNTDCNDSDPTVHTPQLYYVDADHDGFGSTTIEMLCSSTAPVGYATNNTDCNDADVTVHEPQLYYVDADHDGFGSTTIEMLCSSTAPVGYSTNNTDCNDLDVTVHEPQLYYVDADHDGFGSTTIEMLCSSTAPVGYSTNNTDCNDLDVTVHEPQLYYVDADHDGFGSTTIEMLCSSTAPVGYSTNNTDCNDLDVTVHEPQLYYVDADHDGFGSTTIEMLCSSTAPIGYSTNNTDCNDADVTVHEPQLYYVDADHDGFGSTTIEMLCSSTAPVGYSTNNTDCNDADVTVHEPQLYYVDADHDGFGSTTIEMLCSSTAPVGYSTNNTDCNDLDVTVHEPQLYYVDADHDGFGSTTIEMLCSSTAPVGYSTNNTDCNDLDVTVHEPQLYYVDADHDGFGSTTIEMLCSSTAPVGYSTNNTDCNDLDVTVHEPQLYYVDADHDGFGSTTIELLCSSTAPVGYSTNNNDCNDADVTVHEPQLYYVDADHDGFGSTTIEMLCSSTAPVGYSTNNTDCNDLDVTVHEPQLYYVDADHDGFGSTTIEMLCSSTAPVGYSTNNNDCNDANASVHPGATEICNGIDDNCNGSTDEGLTFITYYADVDGDGHGDAGATVSTCDGMPTGYVTGNDDCDDSENTVYPGAPEICDGLDNNCDGESDEGTVSAVVTPSGTVTLCKSDDIILTSNTCEDCLYQWFKNGNAIVGATNSTYTASKPAYFQVQVSTEEGCFAVSDATLVTVVEAPNANIFSPLGLSLCTTVKLKASYDATYTWQWKKAGVPIPGATAYIYYPTTAGSYTCTITSASGCSRTTAAAIVTACKEGETSTTTVAEPVLEIYPNPTDNAFTVNMTLNDSDIDNAEIQLFDIMGNMIYTTQVAVSHETINKYVDAGINIPGGIYVVKVLAGNKNYTQQIIIQK